MLRSASIVGGAFVISRLLGLVREVILARQFGTSGEYDAYVSAFRIPDLLFLVIMAGSFGAAFIPVFGGFLSRDREDQAWALASAVINLAAVVMVAAALFTFALAGPIMRYVVAPGLAPDDRQIAVNAMRLLLLSPIFLGLGIAAKGILEAEDRFTLPALAPVIYNAAIIIGALALSSSIGVYGVAIGVVFGALGHLLVQVPGLIRAGMRYTPHLTLQVDGLREVGNLLLPRIVGQAAFQLNFIVVNAFASNSGTGHVSALNYAWQLMMLPHGVLALSASTVVLPTMARLFEHGQTAELRATLVRALRPLLFLTLPASVGLFAFRVPIVQTAFQSEAFSGHSTRLVTDPLAFLAIGLTGYALVEILARTYYAMHDTRTPVLSGIAIIVLNVALSALLVDRFEHTGLAISLSLTTGVEALILLAVLRFRFGPIDPDFGGWFARVAAATFVMLFVCLSIQTTLAEATEPGGASRFLQIMLFAFALGIGGGSYVIAAYYLRVPELEQLARIAAARVPPLGRLLVKLGDRRSW